jgi:hypothetical protein
VLSALAQFAAAEDRPDDFDFALARGVYVVVQHRRGKARDSTGASISGRGWAASVLMVFLPDAQMMRVALGRLVTVASTVSAYS